MTKLQHKTALVTGAAQGMGLAFAEALAEAGARVILTDVQGEAVQAAAAKLKERGLAAEGHALNVTDATAWAQVVGAVGPIHVLVNNAGVALAGSVEDCALDVWRKTLEINVTGPFLGCQAVIPGMKAAGGGSIINIASIFGLVGEPDAVAYCTSKGAITQFTRSSALKLAGCGIRVNSVHPGFVATPMVAQAMASMPPEMAEAYAARTVGLVPMGRIAESADLVGAVLFLAGDESRFMTGAQMVIDGGFVAR